MNEKTENYFQSAAKWPYRIKHGWDSSDEKRREESIDNNSSNGVLHNVPDGRKCDNYIVRGIDA